MRRPFACSRANTGGPSGSITTSSPYPPFHLPRRHIRLITLGHLHPHRRRPARSPVPPRLSSLPHHPPTPPTPHITHFHSETKLQNKTTSQPASRTQTPSAYPQPSSSSTHRISGPQKSPRRTPTPASKLVAHALLSRHTPGNFSRGGGACPWGALRAACGARRYVGSGFRFEVC